MQDQDHTQAVKNLLATAAGPKGIGDDGWHAAGLERLYFQHPTDVKMAGFVEVRRADDNTEYVRLELHVPPELAAELIGRVTGASIADGMITWGAQPDPTEMTQEEAENVQRAAAEIEALNAIKISVDKGTSTGLELTKTGADMAEKDRARMDELKTLIAQQADDADGDDDLLDDVDELDFERA